MPSSAPKPCAHPGCKVLLTDGSGRCPTHAPKAWTKAKPTKRMTGRRLQRARHELFKRDPLCAECRRQGRVALAAFRDHIVPLEEGGVDDDSNVQGLCGPCHDAKSETERLRGRQRAGGWQNYRGP